MKMKIDQERTLQMPEKEVNAGELATKNVTIEKMGIHGFLNYYRDLSNFKERKKNETIS